MGMSRHDDGGREERNIDMIHSSSDDKPHLFIEHKMIITFVCSWSEYACVCELTRSLWPHRVSYEPLHIHSYSGPLQQIPPEFSVRGHTCSF